MANTPADISYLFYNWLVIPVKKLDFNISYSTLKLYSESPLQFYFQKIKKIEMDNKNIYGELGKAVHKGIQTKIESPEDADFVFSDEMDKITTEIGMFGETIKKENFIKCYNYGKNIVDVWNDGRYTLFPEMKIEFEMEVDGIKETIIGYIDLVCIKDKEIIVHDWKTNSSIPDDRFIDQAKFYSYLIYKKYNIMPRCLWHMLKLGNKITYHFNEDIVEEINNKIINFIREIRGKGYDITKYSEGNWDNTFNSHKELCQREVDRRTKQDGENFILKVERRGNNLFFINLKDTKLLRGLDLKFSYFVDGYMFSDLYKKRIWDGKKHIFNIKQKYIPVGLIHELEEFIDGYNERFNTNFIIEYINTQDNDIINTSYNTKFIEPPFELREYQNEAIDTAYRRRIGIINLPTGVGKSVIIAELLKKVNKRSLVIVSRVELLEQLKEDIENWTGCQVGKMYEGELVIDKQFTIASIQTLYSILKRGDESSKKLKQYLYNVGITIFDEAHLVRNVNMYSVVNKYCINSQYIIGTTATDWRNDCHTLLMNAAVGTTIYKKTPQEMEKAGWILPTKCYFVKCKGESSGSYSDAYKNVIVHNEYRNSIIRDLCEKYSNKYKILIITKLIDHGKLINQIVKNSYLITSQTNKDDRKKWFAEFKSNDKRVLIGSQQIFAQGINIPSLDIIINVGAHVSNVTSIQVVGRVKRLNAMKKKISYYIDFFDEDKNYFERASNERLDILKEFGNEIVLVEDLEEVVIE